MSDMQVAGMMMGTTKDAARTQQAPRLCDLVRAIEELVEQMAMVQGRLDKVLRRMVETPQTEQPSKPGNLYAVPVDPVALDQKLERVRWRLACLVSAGHELGDRFDQAV